LYLLGHPPAAHLPDPPLRVPFDRLQLYTHWREGGREGERDEGRGG